MRKQCRYVSVCRISFSDVENKNKLSENQRKWSSTLYSILHEKNPQKKIVRYFEYWTDKSRDLVIVRLIKLIRTFAHRLVSLAF